MKWVCEEPQFPSRSPRPLSLIPTAVIMPTMQEGRLLFLCVCVFLTLVQVRTQMCFLSSLSTKEICCHLRKYLVSEKGASKRKEME